MDINLNLTIRNELAELALVKQQLNQLLQEDIINREVWEDLWLISEEVLTNIIKYSYGAEKVGTIQVLIAGDREKLLLSFEDTGEAFNPLETTIDPLLDEEIENRPIGGLGIFLVKQLADRLDYSYRDGKNILTLEKSLPQAR
ncbi:MAG: ATP-binding protein [Prochlorotrichaceae cyanobacterium]